MTQRNLRKRKITNKSRAWEKQFVGNSRKSELVDVSCIIYTETEKAVQVTEGVVDANGKEIRHWLPKSQIEIEPNVGDNACTITMPRWLYEEKGFIT